MAKHLEGKTALVFGAGAVGEAWGNGKTSAVLYAREGARVAYVDLNHKVARRTRDIAQEDGEALAFQADVTSLPALREVVRAVTEAFGRIDILYNNVSTNTQGGPVETRMNGAACWRPTSRASF